MNAPLPADQNADPCEKCGSPVYGYVEQRCCDGRECCCMGQSLSPCWCTKCWDQVEIMTSTGAGQGADATTAATEPVRRPGSLPSKEQVDQTFVDEAKRRDRSWGPNISLQDAPTAMAPVFLFAIQDRRVLLDLVERLQQRVAELEPYQERTERLCNLIMRLSPNEGLSPGALSGLQRMAEAAKRASTPPSDDRQASYDAANDRSHPWYWIQQYAVTDPHMGLRKAVQIAWDMAHPATKPGSDV